MSGHKSSFRAEKKLEAVEIPAGGTAKVDVDVPGVRSGDFSFVAAPCDLQGLLCSSYAHKNAVTIVLYNPTKGAVSLDAGTWKVKVVR